VSLCFDSPNNVQVAPEARNYFDNVKRFRVAEEKKRLQRHQEALQCQQEASQKFRIQESIALASNSSVSASASCSSVSGSSSTLALSSSTSASGSTLTGMGVGLVGAGLTAADQDVAGAAVGSDVALAIFQHSVSASNSSSVSTSSHNTSKKVRLNEESSVEAASAVEKPLSQKAKVSGAVCCFANLSDDVRTQLVLKFQNLVGNNSSVSPKFQLQFQKGERGYKGLIQAIISCCGDRDAVRNQLLSHCKYN
jgi:hypothetical protein